MLNIFNITRGCYHIEFKFTHDNTFELIELNPRVGGALIIESTEYISGTNLLLLWLKTLLYKNVKLPQTINNHNYENIKCSAFRVYFGYDIGTIKSIQYNNISEKPSLHNVLIDIGTELLCDKSEQFLAQALWTKTVKNKNIINKFHEKISIESKKYLSFNIVNKNYYSHVFLIVDYNLSRVIEVQKIADIVYQQYNYQTILVTTKGKGIISDNITSFEYESITIDSILDEIIHNLDNHRYIPVSGLVFSDNAIVTGSKLLEHYNLITDSSIGAAKSYDKLLYRKSEKTYKLNNHINTPEFYDLRHKKSYDYLSDKITKGFIIKPRKQGNNMGVVSVHSIDDIKTFINKNQYFNDSYIAEQLIDIKDEFSVDGVGQLQFITKKLSIRGRFPLEIGQVLPPNIDNLTRNKIILANSLANSVVEQKNGAFHNEIMICSRTNKAYVVEPNRRPGGMSIWYLIYNVYQIDLYKEWVLSSFGYIKTEKDIPKPKCSSGYLMLEGPIGYAVKMDILLNNLEFIIDNIYIKLDLNLQNRPKYDFVSFIAPKNYVFKSYPKNGLEFLISIIFTDAKTKYLECFMYKFYQLWSSDIKSILKKLGGLY